MVQSAEFDWTEIVRQHGPDVWRTIWRLLRHEADSADCFQQTFIEHWRLSGVDVTSNPAARLKRIATSRALDRLRQRMREQSRTASVDALDNVVRPATASANQLESRDVTERLQASLVKIPPKQAEAFWLRFVEEQSYEEIADAMRITVNEVGVLIHRARQRLQRCIGLSDLARGAK